MQGVYDSSELPYDLAQNLPGPLEDSTLLGLLSAHISDGLYHVERGSHALYDTVVQLWRDALSLFLPCNGIGVH